MNIVHMFERLKPDWVYLYYAKLQYKILTTWKGIIKWFSVSNNPMANVMYFIAMLNTPPLIKRQPRPILISLN